MGRAYLAAASNDRRPAVYPRIAEDRILGRLQVRSAEELLAGLSLQESQGMDRLGLKGAAAHRCEEAILLKSMK